MPDIRKRTKTASEKILVRGRNHTASQLRSVYKRQAACVYTLCLHLLVDASLAEGATVDVFVRFNQIPARLQDESRTPACLRELAIEAALARLQERNGAVESLADEVESSSRTLASGNGAARLDPARLEQLIVHLPDSLRVSYVLCDVEGLSDADIAARLRLDKADVRRRIHSARLELRRLWLGLRKQE